MEQTLKAVRCNNEKLTNINRHYVVDIRGAMVLIGV